MRSGITLFALLLLSASVQAQQAPTSQQNTVPQPVVDPQALSVLNQAIAIAGGAPAISAIQDYVATGTVTYRSTPDTQGPLTVSARGVNDIRTDASLPSGTRSSVITSGQLSKKAENGTIWRMPPKDNIVNSDAFPYQISMFPAALAFPHLQLSAVLSSQNLNVFYKGQVTLNGQPVFDIQIQRMRPGATAPTAFVLGSHSSQTETGRSDFFAEYNSADFFIDATTYQIVMIQDVLPYHVVHQILYSDYRITNGVATPFSVTEQGNGQQIWIMQLSQFQFNQGLQDSVFVLQ